MPVEVRCLARIGSKNFCKYEWLIDGTILLLGLPPDVYSMQDISNLIDRIKYLIANRAPVTEVVKKIKFVNTIRIMNCLYFSQLPAFFESFAVQFTEERETISMTKLIERIFGVFNTNLSSGYRGELLSVRNLIREIVKKEYNKQYEVFIAGNKNIIASGDPTWKLYCKRCNNLAYNVLDFTKIEHANLRKEVMHYYKDKLKFTDDFKNDRNLAAICFALNFITKNNPYIRYCSDITPTDVRNLILHCEGTTTYSPSSIKKIIEGCRSVINHLIDCGKHPFSYPMPQKNPFDDIGFKNMSSMEKNTDPVPEVVFEQLRQHILGLNPIYQLWYSIFENTGMRAGEVEKLEAGCVRFIEEFNVWVLRYRLSKTLKQRRKRGLSDYNIVVIPEDVAQYILEIETKTKELRQQWDVPYIFIWVDSNRTKYVVMHSSGGFVKALNILAKKHNIINTDGIVWHFSAKQFRKSVAVSMIDQDAILQEIALQFGHIDTRTAQQYYAEVSKKRLADLNHVFFEQKFNLKISKNILYHYSEEERKALYVDFCLHQRDVELGVCIKHFSSGPCSKRTGKSNCATCPNLCTGSKYLTKWKLLMESQKAVVSELEETYKRLEIPDYKEFKEYNREKYFLDTYENVIKKIET